MDEPERKRRGPLTWLAGRSRRFWIGIGLLAPVLYVLSSGPTVPVPWRKTAGGLNYVDQWWLRSYAPLRWVSKQSWGKPMWQYWTFFPTRTPSPKGQSTP